MKYITIPLMFSIILTGCTGIETREDYINKTRTELEQKYAKLTSGEKTVKKAFQLYELYRTFVVTKEDLHCKSDCDYIFCSQKWESDYDYRFCDISIVATPNINSVLTIQLFDKDTFLSDKERYCLEAVCNSGDNYRLYVASYIHNEDECILIRRHLFDDTNIQEQCVFDYKDYIPEYAKIGSKKSFAELYVAYKESIDKCKEKRDSLEITSVEYDDCINSVDERFEKIVKSGVLK